MNRKFTHRLQKIGHDLAQTKAQEEKASIAFMLMDNFGLRRTTGHTELSAMGV